MKRKYLLEAVLHIQSNIVEFCFSINWKCLGSLSFYFLLSRSKLKMLKPSMGIPGERFWSTGEEGSGLQI